MSARQRRVALRVRDIHDETPDARTLVFEPVRASADTAYAAGQFLTLHLPLAPDRTISRSYSMSSCPVSDPYPAITVKREPDGAGSNWLFSSLGAGTVIEASPASGSFTLDTSDKPLELFAAGVGITPIISICKFALRTTGRQVRLHYSSKKPDTSLFLHEVAQLEEGFAGRLAVNRRYTAIDGRFDVDEVRTMLKVASESMLYVCGPAPFIDMVHQASQAAQVPPSNFITEAFTPAPSTMPGNRSTHESDVEAQVSIQGKQHRIPWPRGKPLIDALDDGGIEAPSSCRQGECLTCECRVTSGEAHMRHNGVLDDDDVAEGYALACQLLPKSDIVGIEFA